jgi:hypothetical protein
MRPAFGLQQGKRSGRAVKTVLHAEVYVQIFDRASLQSACDMIRRPSHPSGRIASRRLAAMPAMKGHNEWYVWCPARTIHHARTIIRMRCTCSRASLLRVFSVADLMFYQ